MKKRFGSLLVLLSSVTMAVGVFFSSLNKEYKLSNAADELSSKIINVQLRSDPGLGGFLVIVDENITVTGTGTYNRYRYNAHDNIKLYYQANKDDEVEIISLNDIIGAGVRFNEWSCGGIMFPITNYEKYNGATIKAVEILEGCTYPNKSSGATKIVNETTVKYINRDHLDLDKKDGALERWFKEVKYERTDTKLNIFRAEVRGDKDSDDDFYLDLGCYDFAGATETNYYCVSDYINAYEKIIVYVNESSEGKPLSEITTSRDVVINKWLSQGFMFHIDKANYNSYNGETITRIRLLEGLELIFDNKIYTVSKTYDLYKSDVIPDNPSSSPDKYYACYFEMSEVVYEPIEISLTGAHVRGNHDNHSYFIDITADNYFTAPEKEYFNLNSLNAYDYIKVYVSPTDQGTLLGDVVGSSKGKGVQNRWNSFAFMFEVEENLYENTFNGETIFMIEILKGCEFYYDNGEQTFIAVVDNTYKYCNVDWHDNGHKYMAADFRPDASDLKDFGTIGIVNIHNRMGRTNAEPEEPIINRWIIICLDSYIYDFQLQVNYWINNLNFLDNILIYPSKDSEPYRLREIFDNSGTGIEVKQFNERDYLGISISNEKLDGDEEGYKYDGPHMYMVSFESGTQIPTYENGQLGYRVIPDKTVFINEEYGKTGPNYDSLDDNGNARLYEEWNIKWRIVPCTVTFTVIGIEELTFKNVYLEYGERLYLKDYEIEGYRLVATTSNGDKIFNCVIGSNKNFDVVLTYSQSEEEPPEEPEEPEEPVEPDNPTKPTKGCAGSIALDGILLSSLAIIGVTCVIIKRKGSKHDEK